MSESDSGDELYQLVQRALWVNKPLRNVDLDTVPLTGDEFIYKSRLEDANVVFKRFQTEKVLSPEEIKHKNMMVAGQKGAYKFKMYAWKLTSDKDRDYLKNKFPQMLVFPKNEQSCIKDWCVFCLGSNLCSKIYNESYEKPRKEIKGHLPVLSIVVHFDQATAYTVLQNLHEWFLSIGMEESLGRWAYAVLAFIKKPLDDDFEALMKAFFRDCQKRLKECDESEEPQLYLISAIFRCYFCVNADLIGPPLEAFLNLQM